MNQKPQCPRGHGNLTPKKTWTLKGLARGGRPEPTGTKVTAWRCPTCGYSHRTYDKLEE